MDPRDEADTTPVTMFQLRQQIEAQARRRKWKINGAIIGSTVVVTTIAGLCLWKHRQRIFTIRTRFARRTPKRHVAEDTAGRNVKGTTEPVQDEARPVEIELSEKPQSPCTAMMFKSVETQ
jgi:hypothetical protein